MIFKRDWFRELAPTLIALGAVVGIVAVGFALVSQSWENRHKIYAHYQVNAQRERAEASNRIENECIPLSRQAFIKCFSDNIDTYYAQQYSNKDLQAQQDMALWAFWMFSVGAFSVALSVVGVVLIWKTLLATQTAAKYASDAVDVTREIGIAQTRAYISRPQVEVEPLNANSFIIRITVKNSGNSPAITPNFSGAVSAESEPEVARAHLPSARLLNIDYRSVSSGEELELAEWRIENLTEIQLRRIQDFGIWVRGRFAYRTVFKNLPEQVEPFSVKVRGDREDRTKLVVEDARYLIKDLRLYG